MRVKGGVVRMTFYYYPMWCPICKGEFRASRKHAFLCSSKCRKAFSRLAKPEQMRIREDRCKNSPVKIKCPRRRKKSPPNA